MPDGVLFVLPHFIKGAVNHAQAWIFVQFFAVPDQKVPIQIIKRTGVRAVLFSDIVAAIFAVIRHFIDVAPPSSIGLAGQIPTIRK